MNLIERTKDLMLALGAQWVLWLLVGLSAVSIAAIIERLVALRALAADVRPLRAALIAALAQSAAGAGDLVRRSRHPAAVVALRGIEASLAGAEPTQIEKVMAAEAVAERRRLEQRFALLATLGANAPFIGLFGTVVGILQAFDVMGRGAATEAAALAPELIMSSIAEALVCTAIGLGVAIPAVFAHNYLQRAVRSAMDDAEMLALEVIAATPTGRARVRSSDARALRVAEVR